jgi:alginate O-acetyltransferase complex protein AlgI
MGDQFARRHGLKHLLDGSEFLGQLGRRRSENPSRMSFTSWQFGVFAAVVFAAYYLPPLGSFQVQWLVLCSLFFYGYGQPELLPLLAVAVFGTYFLLVLALQNRAVWLPIGIIFNLALLAFFKYKFLFVDPSAPAGPAGIAAVDFLLRLPLPIGISFFVFHNISLLVDLTRQKAARPDLTSVFLYIIFFPQLVSGPITRAEMFMPQIKPKYFADVPIVEAVKWIVIGFFFKLYVANNLNTMTSYLSFPLYQTLEPADRWLLVVLYSYQIYADFFGYSSIAIGLGLLFGYRLPINFNLPYISRSFSEFWTRWHISLSNWLRTYLYIPLGGNRLGRARTYLNLMVVMGLGGLWHGAAISYLTWGLLHGLFLVVERPILPALDALSRHAVLGPAVTVLRVLVVFGCVSFAWIFFKLPNFDHAMSFIGGMFADHAVGYSARIYRSLVLIYTLPVLLQHLVPWGWLETSRQRLQPYLYGVMAALALVEAGADTSFIYFQF